METINYQGNMIFVEQVHGYDGDMPITLDKDHQGKEGIFRDNNGQYYLQRTLARLDLDTAKERSATGNTFTHRISLTAAALWAVARTSPYTLNLRRDLAEALNPSGFSLRGLDDEAVALVRRYQKETPYDYTAADIIGGCVRFALDQAFDALPEAKEEGLETDGFHDSAWGYVEKDVFRAEQKRHESVEEAGGIVRVVSPEGDESWDVPLSAKTVAVLQEHADAEGITFEEAFTNRITALINEDYNTRMRLVSDRADVALAAAAMPDGSGDEGDDEDENVSKGSGVK